MPWVTEHWAIVDPEDLLAEYEPTLQQPKAWRVLDRECHFGAVLLMGDPAQFRALLDMLRQAPDWTFTRLDATAYLFERSPAKAWNTAADLPGLLAKFAPQDQTMARIQIAHRLMFIGETEPAGELLDEVLKKHPRSREAWTELAFLHGMNREWEPSADAARRALSLSRGYRPARIALASALFGMNRAADAFPITRKLYRETPDDTQALYLHVRVTHAVHAYREEIEVLQKLIPLLQRHGLPTGYWEMYLGQAWSATGQAARAQAAFRAALEDENIEGPERAYVLKALERLDP